MQNNIKNLGAGVITAAVIFYLLILNFSYIGLAGAAVCAGAAVAFSFVYKKNAMIVQKLDIYVLLVYIAALIMNYDRIIELFTTDYFQYSFRRAGAGWAYLIVGIVLSFILGVIANGRKTVLSKALIRFFGYTALGLGICLFFQMDLLRMALPAVLMTQIPFLLISMCALSAAAGTKRTGRIGMLIMLITIALRVFVPGFRFSPYSLNAYISGTILPWYMVLILSVLALAVAGLSIFTGGEKIDTDSLFFVGTAGAVWVIKASLYFYFTFSWIVIFIYLLIFIGFLNRFIKRNSSGSATYVHSMMSNNEIYWTLIAAVCAVIITMLVSRGYIYFAIALIIGAFAVAFIHKGAPGWGRSAAFWIVLVIAVAAAFALLSLQSGYSSVKLTLIAGMAVFAAVIMWMMNHRNNIAHNQYSGLKALMTVILAALMLIVALKAGSKTRISYSDPDSGRGSVVYAEEAGIDWQVAADGKNNSVKKIEYVWSEGFTYDKKDIKQLSGESGTMDIADKHLIIWVEDSYGVVTRTDRWFDQAEIMHLSGK